MSNLPRLRDLRAILLPVFTSREASATRQTLLRILLLRSLFTVASFIGLIIFQNVSSVEVSLPLVVTILGGVILSLIYGFWRVNASWIVSDLELFGHLLLDVVFLVLVLLISGGATNPLISYLLVLLAVGATTMPQAYANSFALGSILIYSTFLLLDLRTSDTMNDDMMNFQLHVVGMWVIFVVSAILIAVFVTRMAQAIRERELTLAQAREVEIRNEQLVALGTLAAGTAHALGTPLSTMAVILSELDRHGTPRKDNEELQNDLGILRQQVNRCRESLSQLTRYYNKQNNNVADRVTLTEFLASIREYITNIHPVARIDFATDGLSGELMVAPDPNIKNAIINIIENGIKASEHLVQVNCSRQEADSRILVISVADDGPGIPANVLEKIGQPFISTRKNSMGLGIYLANASVQKIGGSIELFNRKDGGAMTLLRLPIIC